MISFENVSKFYQTKRGEVRSLDGLSLQVKTGEFVAIRGPSGCGKTTLLLTAGAMLRPTSGRVTADGQDLGALSGCERARFRACKIGFVFQMFHLLPYLSVLENVLVAGGGAAGEVARAGELLDQLGLSGRMHHRPAELSTGERQRTAIARALLNQPKLILADEPTGNLDPENADEVFRHLQAFHRAGGTVVLVTHGTAADAFADRVVEMQAGAVKK